MDHFAQEFFIDCPDERENAKHMSWACRKICAESKECSTMIETPYLLFLGDAPDQLAAKVAQGIKDWRPENAVGQFRM